MPVRDRRALPLLLLCAARLPMGMHFQAIAPVAPLVAADLGLSYAEVGMLVGAYMLPGAFLALPGGLLGRRFADRHVIVAALGLLAAGAATVAVSGSFVAVLAGRLVGGAGSVLLNLYLTKALVDWYAGRGVATAMGLMMAMFPLGIALSLATLGALAVATSWRVAIAATGVYAALVLVAVAGLYRDAPGAVATSERRLWTIAPREIALVLPLAVAWSALNAGFLVYVAFTPTYLVERGFTLAAAGFVVSWASWLAIGTLPLGGWIIDRTGGTSAWIAAATVAAAVTCALLTVGGPPLLWIVLNEILSAPMVAILALAGTSLSAPSRATGLGIFYTVSYAGMVAVPPLAGWLLDRTGTAASALWLAAAVWLVILPALAAFHVMRRRAATVALP